MALVRVDSSVIRGVEYDEGREELVIYFRSGRRYRYFYVPREVYEEFLEADSKGGYYNRYIKGRFPSKRE